jgi:hypothetical protein
MKLFENIDNHPDQEFLEIVERIVSRVLAESSADELFLVEIENWFDHKWLGFSGKNLVPRWMKKTTLPAFNPNRVLCEHHWLRRDNEEFAPDCMAGPLHPLEKQPSRLNHLRKISAISKSAVFAWYSSKASSNKAASLMIYVSSGNNVVMWFAGLRKNPEWRLHVTDRISWDRVEQLMAAGAHS